MFAAAVTPIVLLNGGFGILIAAGVIYYFLMRRGKAGIPATETVQPEEDFAKFRFRRGVATFLAFLAISVPPIAAWILWAFPGIAAPAGPDELQWLTLPAVISAMVGLLLASLLFFWLSVASLRQKGESVRQGYRRALAGRGWAAFRPALTNFAMLFGMMGLASVFPSLSALIEVFERTTRHGRLPDPLEMAIAMPAVPIWLYASIVLMALFRRLNLEDLTETSYHEGGPSPRRSGPVIASAAVAAGAAVMLGALGNVLHLGVLGAYGPVSSAGPIATVVVELEDWVDEQSERGRPSHEIAAELRHFGRWAPASPDHGLVELMPSLKTGKSFERIDSTACRYSIEAGIADIDELGDIDWLPEDEAARPVKYCLTIECPSQTRWPEDATTSLSSSHSSRKRYWILNIQFDIFAWGVAEPGGYCTTSGAVADRFQG
ncbi:MAG: hypothetical protein HKM95_12900 [Inquilinus sp.]|nr:hypothetical protein [Inquilinus sp.]